MLFCTPSHHHHPTSIPTPWIAYSELNSPPRPAGQHLVVSELAVVGGVLGCWTFVQSLKSSHSSCTRRSLVRTYIDDIKTDTILYAIRPPPPNLHSYPVDSIQGVKLTVLGGRVSGLWYRNLRESVGCLVVWLLDQSPMSPTTIPCSLLY